MSVKAGQAHPQVEVDLLRRPIRPLRRDVVRCELDPHPRFTVDEDHVPVVLSVDRAAEHPSPESTLDGQVGRVEDHNLVVDPHGGHRFTRSAPLPVAPW
jgi:hypothetical protein